MPIIFYKLQWGRDQLIAESHPGECHLLGCIQASMGPRSIDRGIGRLTDCVTKTLLLQWGRDQLIAESTAGTFTSVIYNVASMGPRSIDRGIANLQQSKWKEFLSFNGAAIN